MGIRTFTFNGESSDDYGIIINQNASFNAPERAGEMLSIPGRNGAFWQDYGRFENIEVTYHCAVGEGSKADFVDAMSDVRSWLCSPIGYCRLEDDYNPSEYRMAVYKSGLETDEPFLTGAEFDIVFECKPQRYLKSGETGKNMTSGTNINNPTPFDAKPQLIVYGYGEIGIGDDKIYYENIVIGETVVANRKKKNNALAGSTPTTMQVPIGEGLMETGDSFFVNGAVVNVSGSFPSGGDVKLISVSVTSATNCTAIPTTTSNSYSIDVSIDPITFTNQTGSQTTCTVGLDFVTKRGLNAEQTTSVTVTILVSYASSKVTYSVSGSPYTFVYGLTNLFFSIFSEPITAYSTKQAGSPLYIDLETGMAWYNRWNIDHAEPVSMNNAVQLPTELPVLKPGNTKITFSNTITTLKIIPRWWQV